jgi:peptidoglycan hydrolase-like protein with peptidoglycan-binding domain
VSPAAEVPEDLPPPFVPATPVAPSTQPAAEEDEALEATGRMEPVAPAAEPELDPRELKALSRQERKEAKAALRREQQEARNAARQAKAMAKAAATTGRVASAEAPAEATGRTADEGEDADAITESVVEPIAEDAETTTSNAPDSGESPGSSAPTDPRARAAQRVQRRLGKDAEKLSAAEARARAREEARRRRAQAKEQRSGVVAEEVVRPPEGAAEGNLDEDVSVVDSLTEQTIEAAPLAADVAPEPADESLGAEPIAEEPAAIEEPADEEPVAETAAEATEADLPKPVVGQRIDDEPAPVDIEAEEPPIADEPEPVAAWKSAETREIPAYTPASPVDGDEEPKSRAQVGPIAGIVGLVALGISVLLAVGALLVALGFDSGGLYEVLRTVANTLVGPLDNAFDFSGANAERKEHFLAWGAGSIGYLLISFVGQAVQRSNDEG